MEEFDKSSLYYVDSTPEGTRYSLYDTASWKNGLAFKNIDFSETGLPVIKIAELNNGISSSTAYTDKTYSQDVFLTKGDYVFSWSGNPETSIDIYKYNLPDGWLNQHIFKVTPKTEIIDKGFFFYLMKFLKPYFKKIATNKQTTGLGHVTISDLQRMSVTLPPLPTQQKIAAILSSLDDKIELNNKINTNLEQQAGALFKNWFTDCMNSNTKMSNIIDVRDGTHDSPKPQESGYLLVTSKHLEAYSINPTDANFITKEDYDKINERSKVDNGDILLSMIGTVGIVSLVIDNPVTWAIKNMGLFKTSKVEDLKYYLLNYLKSDDVRNYIEQHLAGSTQKYISLSELRNLPINIPEKNILEKFNNIVTPIYEQIVNNTNEIKNLKELRDTLLPKLMNGEIEV